MPKMKKELIAEIIIAAILLFILIFVGWQAYNSYFRKAEKGIEELQDPQPPPAEDTEGTVKPEKRQTQPKGVLSYKGFRDPLEHSLPVKAEEEKPEKKHAAPPKIKTEEKPQKPQKPIILPEFKVTGMVWGEAPPRAIIDDKVYKTGDSIKGAKILKITEYGIKLIYKGREFRVNVQ